MVSGNPSKAVTGTGLGLEFDNIATMSATKVDTASNATLLSLAVTGSTIPTNGIYSPAANQLGFATNSAQRGLIDANGAWSLAAPSSGSALSISGFAGAYTETITASSTVGSSFGLNVLGGTNASDAALQIVNQAGTVVFQKLFGDGHGTLGPSATLGLSWTTAGAMTVAAPTAGIGFVVNGFANSYAQQVNASATSGQSLGLFVKAGTTSADFAFLVNNQANTANYLQIKGDGSGTVGPSATLGLSWATSGAVTIPVPSSGVALSVTGISSAQAVQINPSATGGGVAVYDATNLTVGLCIASSGSDYSKIQNDGANLWSIATNNAIATLGTPVFQWSNNANAKLQGRGPVAAALVDMTPDKGTFTGTYATGFATTPTGTYTWSRQGNQVTLVFPLIIATSNATGWTITGLPAAIQPITTQLIPVAGGQDTGGINNIAAQVSASGTIIMFRSGVASGFTASGNKGMSLASSITYLLN